MKRAFQWSCLILVIWIMGLCVIAMAQPADYGAAALVWTVGVVGVVAAGLWVGRE